jgi:hypothetical protein
MIDLLSDKKEVAEILKTFHEKGLPSMKHGGDDSLCIACPSPINKIFCFSEGDIGRHRIYVRTEKDSRFMPPASGQKIVSTRGDLLGLNFESKIGQERL